MTREMTEEEWEDLQSVEPRTVTLDIEVDDRGDDFPAMGEERILSIVAHDSYTGETRAFFDGDGRPAEELFPNGAPDNVDGIALQPSERKMLIAFRAWFTDKDPDLVTGWNCLPADSTVQMANGKGKKIEDISVGEKIVGVDGQEPAVGEVTNKWESKKKILSFGLSDGSNFRSSEEHRIMVGDETSVSWRKAENIEPGDMILSPRALPADEREETWLTERDMYLAGLIMSDGTMEGGQGITFYNTQKELHDQFYKNNSLTPDGTGCFSQKVLDIEYAEEFNRLGIPFGDKNEQGAKLDTLYHLPRKKIAPFIAGVIDGDGCVSGGQLTISAQNDITRKWYKKLLQRLGVVANENSRVVYINQSQQNAERLRENISTWLSHPEKDLSNFGGSAGPTDTIPEALVETDKGSEERRITNDKLRRGINCKRHETNNEEWKEWVFVPVESVSEDGVEKTYDIETTVSSFIADGVLVHNCDDFDVPYIIKRMEKINGTSPDALSPLGWSGVTNRGEPRIKGRTVYDLLTVYKKNAFTELRSYKLDDVAEEELGEEKIEFDGSFYELYEQDPTKFIKYNAHDVELTHRINEEAGVIRFRDVLRREVGVDFEDSYDNKDFVDMMCRRKLEEYGKVGPTRPAYGEEPDSDFEGARVLEPYDGVAKNVVGIDLASLYPYTMAMFNASPETKDAEGTLHAANGQSFTQQERGLFADLVDEAISLKSDYKEKLLAADGKEEREKWEQKYASAKTITNSIYGVTGWERFFLYDEAVAEAVTLSGQKVLKRTEEYINDETAGEVIYGDTDSNYIKFPDEWDREKCLSEAMEICETLNKEVYPSLASDMGVPEEDCLWDIEVEVYMERFFQANRKKRYAYLATWKDGAVLDEPSISVSGFASERSDSAQLTVETEERVFDAILHGEEGRVGDILYDAADAIFHPDGYEHIGIPGGMNNKIDPERSSQDGYYTFSDDGYPQDAHPRAVWNANKILNLGLGSGDKPKRIYLQPTTFEAVERQIDVIAFQDDSDLEPIADRIRLDTERMLETVLLRPFEEICRAVGVDARAAVRGQEQTGLSAFAKDE